MVDNSERGTNPYSFGTANAAAFLTCGFGSAAPFLMAISTTLPIMGTLIPPSTLSDMLLMSGFGSLRSFWNVLIERRARSGSASAYRRMKMYTSFRSSREGEDTFLTTTAKKEDTSWDLEMSCREQEERVRVVSGLGNAEEGTRRDRPRRAASFPRPSRAHGCSRAAW